MKKIEQLNLLGIHPTNEYFWNLPVSKLVEKTLQNGQGVLTDTGALACDTGKFTGRSPKDKYIVKDAITEDFIWWGDVNHPFSTKDFDSLYKRVTEFLSHRDIYIKDVQAGSKKEYQLNVRVITETPWQSLFAHNLFLRPSKKDLETFEHDWLILAAPEFKAEPEIDKTRQSNWRERLYW